jgi:hypothetical protein
MTTRRGFLGAMLAAAAAPAIVRAASLMPIWVPPAPKILTLAEAHAMDVERMILWGDGIHDDTEALQAIINGHPVCYGKEIITSGPHITLPPAVFSITAPLVFAAGRDLSFDSAGAKIKCNGEGPAFLVHSGGLNSITNTYVEGGIHFDHIYKNTLAPFPKKLTTS